VLAGAAAVAAWTALAVAAWPGDDAGDAIAGSSVGSAPASAAQVDPGGASRPQRWAAAPAAVSAEATRPVRVAVERLGIDAPVIDLGLEPDGSLEVPGTGSDVGWLTTGAVPGRVGPAVLAGHVDSGDGAGVFARLHETVPGDRVLVALDDGSTMIFSVTAVERVAKDAFPTDAVYGPAPTPQLRLITCGGEFDRSVDSYRDNVVVAAVPASAA
jgi:hypothetical protein